MQNCDQYEMCIFHFFLLINLQTFSYLTNRLDEMIQEPPVYEAIGLICVDKFAYIYIF